MRTLSSSTRSQHHLLQILLPRGPRGREPGTRAKRSYETLGRPLEVWHLTVGRRLRRFQVLVLRDDV